MVFYIDFYIFMIELTIYCIFINHITFSCLKVKILGKKSF